MPRSLRGLALAGALLVLAGCSVGGREAREPTKPQPISKTQLAAMVLPQEELGTMASGTKPAPDGGAVTNAEAAESSLDPEDTGSKLRSAGRLGGHKAYFVGGVLAAQKVHAGLFLVGTEVELLEDPVYAAQYLHKQVGDFQRFAGRRDDGATLSGVSGFQVTGVGDEAEGLHATSTRGNKKLRLTAIAFRRGRIVAVAAIVRADANEMENDVRALAVKLDERIQEVLAGRLGPQQAPPAEEEHEAAPAGADRLPHVTLAAEDVGQGVTAVDEGALTVGGEPGYQRTFEDVVVGGSHLIRLQVQTTAYETPQRAAAAHRLLRQAVGREIFAGGIARAFGKQTAVTPSNIRVRSVSTGAADTAGMVATFELVGARFKIVTFFTRSGPYVQSVTGICRPDGVQTDDLEALAGRAHARLVA